MRPSDLDESVFEDLSDLEADLDRINLDSPLQLLSPDTLQKNEGVKNPWQGGPCSAGPVAEENPKLAEGVTQPLSSEDTVSNLPSFNRKKKVDPRRQSTAIFSALKLSSSGAGLLEDSEIALAPDEDLLIPLNKSIPFAITKKSTLWIDPNNEELMDVSLPEPEFLSPIEDPLSPKRIEESVDKGAEHANERCPFPPRERKENADSPDMPNMPNGEVANDLTESFQSQKATTTKGFLKPSRLRAPSSSSRFFQSCTSQLNSRICEPSRDRATQREDAKIVSPFKTFTSSQAQAGTPNETWKLPAKVKRSPSTVPRSMTRVDTTDSPQSSYYRWLDQNPQLAFQAANKLANSPAVQQVLKKKTAEERHYDAWGPSLTALNERRC